MTHDDRSSDIPAELRAVAALVAETRADRFTDGFGDRVADRVAERLVATARRDDALVLARHVRRIVPLIAAASLVLAATNWWSARDAAGSTLDRALGIPSATVADALTLSANPNP